MRPIALAGAIMMLVACGGSGAVLPSSPVPSPAITATEAADLRVQLELLLVEQAFLFAKESEAAVLDHPQYAGYLNLLESNQADIVAVFGRAFGNTAAAGLSDAWKNVDNDLVQYGVGVASHDKKRSANATADLAGSSMPALVQEIGSMTGVDTATLTTNLTTWSTAITEMVDDAMAGRFDYFYAGVATAYGAAEQWGAAAAESTATKFPDKYPGDPSTPPVDHRVGLGVVLEAHSYLLTMMTNAYLAGRHAEVTASSHALTANAEAIAGVIAEMTDGDTSTQFLVYWSGRTGALAGYATGQVAQAKQLLDYSATQLALLLKIPAQPLDDQDTSALKAIDDQRSKSYDVLPADDRAAASAMQQVADAVAGAA